jgi:hypothetical protein
MNYQFRGVDQPVCPDDTGHVRRTLRIGIKGHFAMALLSLDESPNPALILQTRRISAGKLGGGRRSGSRSRTLDGEVN